jgi:hypothetical protein
VFVAHVVLQALPLLAHANPLHDLTPPGSQVPDPSHVPAWVSVPFVQEVAPHAVPFAVCSQPPAPSQSPSLPHTSLGSTVH